ncbi:MAG: DUF4886 domain-containing protein, partial [Clostridia bacterium]|nr:DUF4886 domain-containing protein [Clostridia bacterium]
SKQKCAEEGIKYIVPSGKAFQNARATAIGDNLNTDGYHANAMGCFLAGHCFFTTITGSMPSTNTYRPSGVTEDQWKLLKRAVTDACNEYGYVTYRKDGKYIPALEKLTRVAGTVDGMMIAGNLISDSTDDLESFKAITADYIDGAAMMFTLSEHDKSVSSNAGMVYASLLSDYYTNDLESSAQKRKGNRHFKVKGIDVIGISYDKLTDGFATYTDDALNWLDGELAAIESDMPVFVVTSFPVNHTIGSRGASRICDVLKKYQNVIVFSGGTTAGVTDNLIIHSEDGVTYVNVGSLADETANGLLVEVDGSGNVRIRRYDFITGAEYAWLIINASGEGLDAYAEGYYEAPVVNVQNGAEFDLTNDDAPAMTWLQDGEKATLDGSPCAYGTVVTAAGEHTLVVTAGDKQTSVSFTIADNTPDIVVSIADGAEFDLYTADDPIAATWTPEEATATLNGEAYVAGTAITEVGDYALVVTNGSKSATVNFTVIDSRPPYKRGDMDGDGEITVGDALKALRIAAKLVVPAPEDYLIGDVDNDGEITVGDALKILRVAAQLISEDELN